MRSYLITILALLSLISLSGQNKEEKVRVSPKAEVMQVVGFTEVRIIYSRPGVKGREIWGGLVPYNQVWRAGANEATKFIFSTDVLIEGKPLKAGSYSFFAIPGKNEWTLIFNKVADQWGAFEYNETQDALRIKVKPEKSSVFQEWLTYTITRTSDYSAVIRLEWEKLKVPFKIEVKP
ncbi:MAG: hypothetical protein KatS3mg036_0902 [Ignavibacterium sp.]|uniref:DUF2911 domain-containing protein n=1 Tax=Ignavibacterium album TaxID=591197 RepID=UPI0021DCBCA8|nr:DUF2911 domain-containing protein [Ignavibacterium album]GIV46084.1 MAG: hypothetical protein KatS3mg036_0902 [Ignavibacterium sp.]